MAMPVVSVEKKGTLYNESANCSVKEIPDGTFSQVSTFSLTIVSTRRLDTMRYSVAHRLLKSKSS
jgi:hypothetical protein